MFQHNVLRSGTAPVRRDLAKFPAMRHPREATFCDPGAPFGPRRGFRHELASMLGMFEWLYRIAPGHAAVSDGVSDLVAAGVLAPAASTAAEDCDDGISKALRELSAAEIDLVGYLLAAHHGKVRGTLQSTALD